MSQEKNTANYSLTELHSSGYEIADGEPDIRGWKVRTNLNEEIGKVKELLFDTMSLRVRYLIVDLDGKRMNLIDRDVIIPIGLAELHEKDNIVLFPAVAVGHLASLPDYKKGKVTLETEREVRNVFAPAGNTGLGSVPYHDVDFNDPGQFYDHEHFDESRMYKTRGRSGNTNDSVLNTPGTANTVKPVLSSQNIKQDIEEQKTELTRQREEDEKIANRNSSNKVVQEGSFAPFQEGAIEIKEHSEVPVVSKEARVVEEVSLNKNVSERNEKVKDTVRRTEIDVEKLGKDDLLGE